MRKIYEKKINFSCVYYICFDFFKYNNMEFAREGVKYWETEIPEDVLETIKEIYPKTWKEYIKKY